MSTKRYLNYYCARSCTAGRALYISRFDEVVMVISNYVLVQQINKSFSLKFLCKVDKI